MQLFFTAGAMRKDALWPALALAALLLSTTTILLFNQRHSGDPLKVRREMRKF
jgi:hypothetical protein